MARRAPDSWRLRVVRELHCRRGMNCWTTFQKLELAGVSLERAWNSERELSGLRVTLGDVRHHMCMAMSFVDRLYDELEGDAKIAGHEAYLSVLALGQLLRRAIEDDLAGRDAVEHAMIAVGNMLDVLTPYVSRADDALRHVLLDDESLDDALARIERTG